MLDLVLPLTCGGCGAPATRWCAACARTLAPAPDAPRLVTPRVDPGVPVFSLGRYAGPRRAAIVAFKEHGRADLAAPLADAVTTGLRRLYAWRLVTPPLVLVPAPTRRLSARRRGGDPVTRLAVTAARRLPHTTVSPVLRLRAFTKDSVGLSGAARQHNIAGNVVLRRAARLPGAPVLLVDDIVTTGATAAESVRMLAAGGAAVLGVLVVAHA
ncbi:ComF family protein [Mycobacterium sp. MYCO198283]|uniref:ComF family protein n=1 Tax=Mycobacterium sp. MYCO198283 TaxID=2883505 RepID=UPI001E619102|nr:ComF family protein [Mycobacterium sp. MYCO198283]MCG5431607.1 ComF family protein [Mycobacterium sp. MYCO198283]